MDDEFKLCWKNFQDNIASGFQNLYDRGDLVDVTLACDGKLLHAHKIVLAICSPYFQEIFITNPCKHPIIILKDVTFNIMCELLEFMYQGVVNVKHTELQSFMKIGQLLQIKGLATNASSSTGSISPEKSASQTHHADDASSACGETLSNSGTTKAGSATGNGGTGGGTSSTGGSVGNTGGGCSDANTPDALVGSKLSVSIKSHSPASSPSPMGFGTTGVASFKSSPDSGLPLHHTFHASSNLKRHSDLNSDALSIYSRKQYRRSMPSTEPNADHSDSADADAEADYFLSSLPHLASNSSAAAAAAAASLRSTFNPAAFGFDYSLYKNSGGGGNNGGGLGSAASNSGPNNVVPEYPNDLHIPSDYSKGFANHMDIPSIAPGEHWFHGKLEFMLSQRGKPLLVHDGHTFGIQYVRKDKKYWQCNLSRKFNCKARVTTTDTGEIIVTNNEHCHTEIRQHLRKDYQRNKVMMNALLNLSTNRFAENLRRQSSQQNNLNNLSNFAQLCTGQDLSQHREIVEQNQLQHSQGSLDFAKDSSIMGMSTPPPRSSHSNQRTSANTDLDDVAPLDCGIRSTMRSSLTTDEGCIKEHSKSNNGVGDSPNNSNWKCKNELVDS